MKKRVIFISAVSVALLAALLLVLLPDNDQQDERFVGYWQSQGLSLEDAKYLSSQGRNRIEEPATMAAFNEESPEQVAAYIFQERLTKGNSRLKQGSGFISGASDNSAKEGEEPESYQPNQDIIRRDQGTAEEMLELCQDRGCQVSDIAPRNIRSTSSFIFWETNISAVVLTQYCTNPSGLVGEPLFSEFYFIRDSWVPTFILQPLRQTDLEISKEGKRDLRQYIANFQKSCRT